MIAQGRRPPFLAKKYFCCQIKYNFLRLPHVGLTSLLGEFSGAFYTAVRNYHKAETCLTGAYASRCGFSVPIVDKTFWEGGHGYKLKRCWWIHTGLGLSG
jgi:hypothetical protein